MTFHLTLLKFAHIIRSTSSSPISPLVYDSVNMDESTAPLVESNPNIMMGKPVIVGTRITVESILERLASGESREQLLSAHPRLTEKAIDAALAFAARALRADVVYPVPGTPDKAA